MKHLIGMFVLSLSVAAQAQNLKISEALLGPISSGGGMGVVCYNPDSTIKSVELLDLWEARKLYQREIIPSDKSVKEQVLAGLENLKHSIDPEGFRIGYGDGSTIKGVDALYEILKGDVQRFLYEESSRHTRRLRGVELSLTDDAYEVIKPIDCKLKQLVRYIDNFGVGDVIINQDLVDQMDSLNLAALYLHEVFYALLRGFGEQSSIRVRRTIGLIFGGHVFKPWDAFLPEEYILCEGDFNKAYVYSDTRYEDQLNRLAVTARMSAVNGRYTIGNNRSNKWSIVNALEDVFRTGSGWAGTFGADTGNDFSYRFRTSYESADLMTATMTLETSPDVIDVNMNETILCKKVSK